MTREAVAHAWRAALATLPLAIVTLLAGCHRVSPGEAKAAHAPAAIQLAESDLAAPIVTEYAATLPISGSLEPRRQVVLRARHPGELRAVPVDEGGAVRAGQVVVEFEREVLATALTERSAMADALRAEMNLAERALQSQRELVRVGYVSAITLATAEAAFEAKHAGWKAALAQVDAARKALSETTLRAPMSGVLFKKFVQPGEFVNANTPLISIVDTTQLEFVATLSAADRAAVKIGDLVRLVVAGPELEIEGRVERISPMAESGTRAFLVYVGVPNTGADLHPGLFARGELRRKATPAVAVPLSALRGGSPAPFVWAVEERRARRVPVTVRQRDEKAGVVWVEPDYPGHLPVIVTRIAALEDGALLQVPVPSTARR